MAEPPSPPEKMDRANKQGKFVEEARKKLTNEEQRANSTAQMKGASSWLNALPLGTEDYYLKKRNSFDVIQIKCLKIKESLLIKKLNDQDSSIPLMLF